MRDCGHITPERFKLLHSKGEVITRQPGAIQPKDLGKSRHPSGQAAATGPGGSAGNVYLWLCVVGGRDVLTNEKQRFTRHQSASGGAARCCLSMDAKLSPLLMSCVCLSLFVNVRPVGQHLFLGISLHCRLRWRANFV
jgi:hypothetical protein